MITLLLTLILSVPAQAWIIGENVRAGGSPSTCKISGPDGYFCSGALLKNGTIKTAGHCVKPEWLPNLRVTCGDPERSVLISGPASSTRRHPLAQQMSELEPLYPYDAGELIVAGDFKVAGRRHGAARADPLELKNFFDSNAPFALRAGVHCWSESYGPDRDGVYGLNSAPVTGLTLQRGVIRYEVTATVPKTACPECFEKSYDLYTSSTVFKLLPYFKSLQYMSVHGDSGSPLYCRHPKKKEARFLVGNLSGGLRHIEADPTLGPESVRFTLGTYWVPAISAEDLTERSSSK